MTKPAHHKLPECYVNYALNQLLARFASYPCLEVLCEQTYADVEYDGINDTIYFVMDSRYVYSQLDQDVNVGGIIARTEKKGNINEVTLTKDYSGQYNITSQNKEELKELTKASTPYKIIISDSGGNIININVTN